jgi:SAM-dependent methyltransferase
MGTGMKHNCAARGGRRATLGAGVGAVAFGLDAQGYHDARLPYPDELYDELFGRLPSKPHILEIGAGTGLVTEALLARKPAGLTAIEADPALVRFTEQRLADPRLTMVTAAFPDAEMDGQFDLIACAAAFHWMQPGRALARALGLLHPQGIWAMWWHSYCNPGKGDPVADQIMPLLADLALPPSWTPLGHYGLDESLHRRRLEEAGFRSIEYRLFRYERRLTTAETVGLYESYSFVRMLPAERKSQLLRRISELIDDRFGGLAPNLVLTPLYFATR